MKPPSNPFGGSSGHRPSAGSVREKEERRKRRKKKKEKEGSGCRQVAWKESRSAAPCSRLVTSGVH